MKLVSVSLAVSAFLAVASAQSNGLAGLPPCAQDCANNAIPKNCGLDVKCICTAKSFIEAITCCVAKKCNKQDQEATIKFANGICGTAQVTDLPQSAVCSSGGAATATQSSSSASSSGSHTASPTESSSSSASASPSASASASPSESASGSATAKSSASGTQSAQASSSPSKAAAISNNAHGGAVAALAALAVALA